MPFFHFLSLGPLKLGNFDRLVQRIFCWFGVLFLGRTGKQLFVLDNRQTRDPLVVSAVASSPDILPSPAFSILASSHATLLPRA